MVGHFKKRGDRWYFWVELEPGLDGKRRQYSRGGFKTRKEAEKAYAEVRDQVRRGEFVTPSKVTLSTFLRDEWFPAIRATTRPSTWDHYARIATGYLHGSIGDRRLGELTPGVLNAFYAELLASGRRFGVSTKGAGLSPKTVRHVHTMLHKALVDAVRWGRLQSNPADRADPPKPRQVEMKVWDLAQLRTFLDHVADDRVFAAWLLMTTTGMRRGEVVGLRWTDVDLDLGRLAIVQTHVLVDRQVIVSEPKTAKGRRTVALDATTLTALRQHRKRQLEERLALGEAWQDTGLVFTHEDGSGINPRLFSSWFIQRSSVAGLPPIRLHDVRHSYATAALAAGVPTKIVSERLGHASIAITLDTYSHVLPNMQEEAAEQIARLILGN
jgi:integrase